MLVQNLMIYLRTCKLANLLTVIIFHLKFNKTKMKSSEKIRNLYIKFFESKGHKEAPNAPLIPLNDPSVLFTTAGMHPLVPYLLGQPHPLGKRLVNVQKCVRTNDIEEVGDTTHLTFFEMLGYWSLGDYFKEEALEMTFEFFTSEKYMNFDPKRLYVTVFEGDDDAPMDQTSIDKWKKLFKKAGIEANVWNRKDFNDENLRIFPLNKKENWWGPAGATGPCGPDSELFYWRGEEEPDFSQYVPWDDSNMFIEISNDVFMQYNKTNEGNFEPLKKNNVDFGSGLERVTMISQLKLEDGSLPMSLSVFDTDLFDNIIKKIEEISGKKYSEISGDEILWFRSIAEHIRSSVFILGDEVRPSNKDQGYVLRRLIRRMIRFANRLNVDQSFTKDLALVVIEKMKSAYPHLEQNKNFIIDEIDAEEIKFRRTLEKGLREIQKLTDDKSQVDGKTAFYFYETFGFPLEMTLEEFEFSDDEKVKITSEFEEEKKKHQEQSRSGAEQKFAGGLADQSEETTKLHTAHHLLLKALQEVLGDHVKQRGSNITSERLRIDFSHDDKLTESQVEKVEKIVNEKIDAEMNMVRIEMKNEDAQKLGAEMEFGQKYPDVVSVYFVTSEEVEDNPPKTWFSAEFCGGPHVENTLELAKGGKRFKIIKQENIGSGKRRIKAALIN